MNTVYEVFNKLWSQQELKAYQEFLKRVYVIRIPDELPAIGKADPAKTIIVVSNTTAYMAMKLFDRGFSHCLSPEKKDFARELLNTCILILKPEYLLDIETPFFRRELAQTNSEGNVIVDRFSFSGNSSADKTDLMSGYKKFLEYHKKTTSIFELAVQILDELYTNAVYGAGVEKTGIKGVVKVERTNEIDLSYFAPIKIYSILTSDILYVGCIDPFGNLNRKSFIDHLSRVYSTNSANPNLEKGGAGLGLKMIIDSTSSLYVYCEKNKRTVVTCSLSLKGMKENLKPSKHYHLLFQ